MVETGNGADAAFPRQKVVPSGAGVVAYGGNLPQACDDDSSLTHVVLAFLGLTAVFCVRLQPENGQRASFGMKAGLQHTAYFKQKAV